jgi:hypothetical protein
MVSKNNKNKSKSNVRRRNKASSAIVVYSQKTNIPSRFPRAFGDELTANFKFSSIITIPANQSYFTGLIVLGKGSPSSGYEFLSHLSSLFSANSQVYTRWLISDLRVEVRATGVGGTANTFIAASYIPSNSSTDSPPNNLAELSNSMHYAESSLGTVGAFRLNCTDYFNDWRQVVDSDDGDAQMGLIQLYSSGVSSTTAVQTGGVVTVSGRLHFCGLKL